ncbi:Ccc1 family, partial [Pavlovales sp. CCMP2436]
HLKSFIFGGLDGIITTFAVVAAVVGGNLDWTVAVTLGVSNVLGTGISMGLGDYYSTKAEEDLARAERVREGWEYDNHIEGERAEMCEVLESHGFTVEDAKQAIFILSKRREFFVDFMMTHELGILPPPEGKSKAAFGGLVMFLSFELFGSVPLVVFCALQGAAHDAGLDPAKLRIAHFGACIAATFLTKFALGMCKAYITGSSLVFGGVRMMANGAVAGGVVYLLAWAMSEIAITAGWKTTAGGLI